MRQHISNKIPHCKTQQNTLAYIGPTLWYSIIVDTYIDDCTSMNIFIKAIKRYRYITINTT